MAAVRHLRRWWRYRRALTRGMNDIEDRGYRVSPGQYEKLKAEARHVAMTRRRTHDPRLPRVSRR